MPLIDFPGSDSVVMYAIGLRILSTKVWRLIHHDTDRSVVVNEVSFIFGGGLSLVASPSNVVGPAIHNAITSCDVRDRVTRQFGIVRTDRAHIERLPLEDFNFLIPERFPRRRPRRPDGPVQRAVLPAVVRNPRSLRRERKAAAHCSREQSPCQALSGLRDESLNGRCLSAPRCLGMRRCIFIHHHDLMAVMIPYCSENLIHDKSKNGGQQTPNARAKTQAEGGGNSDGLRLLLIRRFGLRRLLNVQRDGLNFIGRDAAHVIGALVARVRRPDRIKTLLERPDEFVDLRRDRLVVLHQEHFVFVNVPEIKTQNHRLALQGLSRRRFGGFNIGLNLPLNFGLVELFLLGCLFFGHGCISFIKLGWNG